MSPYELKNWQEEVIEDSYRVPVLVDFWADWCGPCRMLGPVLEKLAKQAAGAWKLVKVDTESNQQLAQSFGIRSIPHCKLFFEGKPVNEFTGALPEDRIAAWLKKAIPSPADTYILQAEAFLLSGDDQGAALLLRRALELDGGSTAAKVLLARALILYQPAQADALLLELEDYWGDRKDLLDAIQQISLVLKNYTGTNAASVDPAEVSFYSGLQALLNKNIDAALDAFIGSVKENRTLFDETAYKTCIALFTYLGNEHPVTIRQRKAFGRALYV